VENHKASQIFEGIKGKRVYKITIENSKDKEETETLYNKKGIQVTLDENTFTFRCGKKSLAFEMSEKIHFFHDVNDDREFFIITYAKYTITIWTDSVDRKCSFCGKPVQKCQKLIAGPYDIFICNECIDVCVKILLEDGSGNWIPNGNTLYGLNKQIGSKLPFLEKGLSDSRNQILFISPDTKQSDSVYSDCIRYLIKNTKYDIKHINKVFDTRPTLRSIWKNIINAALVIVDITGYESGIMYLTGLMHVYRKPIILISSNEDDIPPDFKKTKYIIYNAGTEGYKKLQDKLTPIIKYLGEKGKDHTENK
jgi:hypothetical protein